MAYLPPVPNPDEVATVIAGGYRYDDWESVTVVHRRAEAWPEFTFTAVERERVAGRPWVPPRFKPEDDVAIYLGGVLAIVGVIVTRQVAYDANKHQVQLYGKGNTWYPSKSSIIDEEGNFDGMTFEQVARKVIAPFGVGIEVIGKLPTTPFKDLQVQPGENLWSFLERTARPVGVVMGSDHMGNFLLIGEHPAKVEQQLIEGVNILSCTCVATCEHSQSEFIMRGQTPADDEQNGRAASQQEAKAAGRLKRYAPLLTTAEQPVWSQAELMERARNEAVWNEGKQVEATVTVQGWHRSKGALWRAGSEVGLYSPMAMLDEVMTIMTATFTQGGGGGTTTALTCVPTFLMKAESEFNMARADVPQDPRSYETATPAPPATRVPEPPPLIMPA